MACARRAAVPVDVEIDPALYRPHDAPVVIGDHARLTRDTGWRPTSRSSGRSMISSPSGGRLPSGTPPHR